MYVVWRVAIHVLQFLFGGLLDRVLDRHRADDQAHPMLEGQGAPRPPRSVLKTIGSAINWTLASATRMLIMSLIPLMFYWGHSARDSATAEWRKAAIGVNNSKCAGELTDAQRETCDEYFATLDKSYLSIWLLAFISVAKKDTGATLSGAWQSITNSAFGWAVYIGLFVSGVWLVVRLVAFLSGYATHMAAHSGIVAYDREQAARYSALPDDVRAQWSAGSDATVSFRGRGRAEEVRV
jgi:hypothetical protein